MAKHLEQTKVFSSRLRAAWASGSALAFAIVVALFVAAPAGASETSVFDVQPAYDHGLLGEGRQAYRERADKNRGRDAYRIFKQNYQQNPDDPVAAWHFSMSCYYLGHRVIQDKDARRQVHAEGRAAADRGLARDSGCGPCHLLSAINHALWAEQVGIFRSLVGLPTVRKHLKRAAELDPSFAGAAAHRTMAQITEALPRMFGGGREKTLVHIGDALKVAPQEPLNYEIMVDLMIKEKDLPAALYWAKRGIAVREPAPEYVESRDAIEYMKKIVELLARPLHASRQQ